MTDYRLPRSGDAPLAITAEKIAASDGERQAGRERNRWHDLAIYRLSDGRYAVAIDYRTRWQGELDHHHVVVVASGADVSGVLRLYDPAAVVKGYPAGVGYERRQAALLADVRQRYEAQVSELLDNELFAVAAGAGAEEGLRRQRDLERYRELLRLALAEVALTRDEACLLCDANNGIGALDLYGDDEQTEWRWWPANVEDDLRLNDAGAKWGVDGPALMAKVRALSPVQLCAVADAMERFWQQPERNTDELLREVGLLRSGSCGPRKQV